MSDNCECEFEMVRKLPLWTLTLDYFSYVTSLVSFEFYMSLYLCLERDVAPW